MDGSVIYPWNFNCFANKVLFFLYLIAKSPGILFSEFLLRGASPLKISGSRDRAGDEQDDVSLTFLYDFCILDKNELRYLPSHRKRG